MPAFAPSDLSFTDLLCGGGGSTLGLSEAGFHLAVGINHDPVAIATHRANFPDARHECVNLHTFDKRLLPRTQVMWGSIICTESSPNAGGKRTRGQMALNLAGLPPAKQATFDRTRATALDILAATEVHHYDAVIIENVIEFARDWELFDWWLKGMQLLGYNHQIVCASSAHLGGEGNPLAPQFRDRLYIVFTRVGIPLPDLTVTPEAVCPECGPVLARQVWRNPRARKIGKWGRQYDYRCPRKACKNMIVYPVTRPVSEIIQWDVLGRRIADGRPDGRPYRPSTRIRVQAGIDRFGHDPFVAMLRRNGVPVSPTAPIPTVNARGRHHALIVPIGRKGLARTTDEPVTTIATKQHHSLVRPAPTVDDSTLRMFTVDELFGAQRFPPGYQVVGNQTEGILQAGNAVSVNAAHWLGKRLLHALAA